MELRSSYFKQLSNASGAVYHHIMPENQTFATLVLCRDLLFVSKITATAQAMQKPVKVIRDTAKLADEPAGRMIVDLNQAGFLDAAAAWKKRTGGFVTGFAGHTDVETIKRAETEGIDQVFSKGAFTAQLQQILSQK